MKATIIFSARTANPVLKSGLGSFTRGALPLPLSLLGVLLWSCGVLSQTKMLTYHNDDARTGTNANELVLGPGNVNQYQFGKLFSHYLDGVVFAQPLYVPNVTIPGLGTHNVVYIATEHNSVSAFDADDNLGSNAVPLWTVNLGPSVSWTGDITPEMGITSTPVIDDSTGTLYVVAFTIEARVYYQRLHALDITTGQEKFGGPVIIQASVPGTGSCNVGGVVSFNPLAERQRAGLLLLNGVVYVSWASSNDVLYCWTGWTMGYDALSLAQSFVHNVAPNGYGGGIWQSGVGIAGDEVTGNFYLETGDGTFDGDVGGADFGDSVLKFGSAVAGGPITLKDYFTPYDQQNLRKTGFDLGSAGALVLPDQPGPHPHLLLASGRSGTIYLIDRDNMGHFNSVDNSQIVQSLPNALTGLFGGPAYWNNTAYFLGTGYTGTTGDVLKGFSLSGGLLSSTPISQSTTKYLFPDATPSVSANGSTNGIVWILQNSGYSRQLPSVLHAYDATDLSKELYNSNQAGTRDPPGGAVKFTVPTVVNGQVHVAGRYQLTSYGLLHKVTVVPPSLSFGAQLVNTTSPGQKITLTNNNDFSVTITGVTASGNFAESGCGTSLLPGAQCTISVTFNPTTVGTIDGAITISDTVDSAPPVVSLSGQSVTSVALSPSTLSFGSIAVGSSSVKSAKLKNNQPVAVHITNIAATANYMETDSCGGVVGPGATCVISVTFAPTSVGAINGAVTIMDDANPAMQVLSVAGTGTGSVTSTVTLLPRSLSFGNQLIQTNSASKKVTVTNNATVPLTISQIRASGYYQETDTCPLSPNSLAPNASCTITVKFTPAIMEKVTGAVSLTDDANNSPQAVGLSGTGVPPVSLSKTTLLFGSLVVGSSSTPQTVTVTNNLTVTLNIQSVTITGEYVVQSNSCGPSLSSKQTCTISLVFNPAAAGVVNGALTIVDDASSSPQVVSFSGTGVTPAAIMVHLIGAGTGNVTSSPAGINCGATCIAGYLPGTALTLTATAVTGSTFTGWSGCDSTSGSTCRVTTGFDRAISANFN